MAETAKPVDHSVKYGICQRVGCTALLVISFERRVLRTEDSGEFFTATMQDLSITPVSWCTLPRYIQGGGASIQSIMVLK